MPIGSVGCATLGTDNTFTGINTFSNKLNTSAGIIGPTASLTYTSDMIGYSTGKIFGNPNLSGGASPPITTTSNVWATVTDTGFTFPSLGVWLVTLHCFHNKTNNGVGGSVTYQYAGLGTSKTIAPSGDGSYSSVVNGTSVLPTTVGFVIGESTRSVRVSQPISTIWYVMYMVTFVGVTLTTNPASSFYQLTRIA